VKVSAAADENALARFIVTFLLHAAEASAGICNLPVRRPAEEWRGKNVSW